MRRTLCLFVLLALSATFCFAEDPEVTPFDKGTAEIGIWTGGGHALNGRTKDTELFIGGVRYGKVLTGVHGSGLFRGNFEYVLEAVPLFVVFQKQTTTAGFDFTPLLLKWNFTGRDHRPVAFAEIGAGTVFTRSEVPEVPVGVSRLNFTPQCGFGLFLFANHRRAAMLEFKYIHISNAGFDSPNPGLNSLHVLFGYNWFR
jgi:hypothetical protein